MESSNPKTKNSSSTFHAIKTVSLKEWWLVKSENEVEGKTLAVAGLQSSGQGAVRVFSSSTIIKRCDVFTLETADGVRIVFNGYINKPRTCRNGFSSEVFNDFLFGFPPNWEKYATGILGRACAITVNLERNSSFESCESPSKDVNIVSEVSPEPRDSQDEPAVTLEDEGNMASENEDKTTHIVICKKSLNATVLSPQKECHLDVMPGLVSTSKYIETEGIGPSSIGGKLGKSKMKSRKGNRGEILGSTSIVRDKIIEQNSAAAAADSLKNAKEKKLKKKSSAQSKKKSTKSESTSKDGTKKKIDFEKYSSPLSRREKETSVVSPESMNLKRSRSGRLLLPSLEFWRNQKANYNRHGQLTGIQDGLKVADVSKDQD